MNRRLEMFLIISNPIAWVFYLFAFIFSALHYLGEKIGVNDWLFVWFQLEKLSPQEKRLFLKRQKLRTKKFFIIKQMAWDRAVKILEKEK